MVESGPFEPLEGHRYIRLTTFRRSGIGVPTTVWFAFVEGKLYVFTSANSGKPKMQRSIQAEARIMGKDQEEMPNRVIDQKYGWQYRLFNRILELPKTPPSTSSSSCVRSEIRGKPRSRTEGHQASGKLKT